MSQSRVQAQNATATSVRTGSTFLKGVRVIQQTLDAPRLFLQIFNSGSPTVGTTAPEVVIPVPAGDANATNRSYVVRFTGALGGILLGTGCAFAVTTTHDGLTAPDAGDEPVVILDFE